MNNRPTHAIAKGSATSLVLCGALLAACLIPGCIELGIITPIGTPTETPTTTPTETSTGDGGTSIIGDPAPGDGASGIPIAALTVSNTTPQLNEEVTLTCRVAGGDNTGARFDFAASQPPATGLNVNRSAGRATFIVTESDLNNTFRFTCSVTTDAGQSAASSAQFVTPSGL